MLRVGRKGWMRRFGGRNLRASSRSENLPSNLISRAVHLRGPVSRPIPRAMRSATTSLIVRPVRRARDESAVLPSSPTSFVDQAAPFLTYRFGGRTIYTYL